MLAVHLVALGALPFAVSGACFHLLPVMLRNDLPSQRALWVALPLLGGGFLVDPGLGPHDETLVWVGAAAVSCGLALILWQVLALVVRSPRGRLLIASRLGVAASCAHVVAALLLGSLLFGQDRPLGGLDHGRGLLIHLHVALIGWIALLVLTVGRSLAPMLAHAPAAPARAWPVDETALVCGLWLLVAGLATHSRTATIAGGAVAVVALARFAKLLLRTLRVRRAPLEAPLGHLLAGALFLAQAVVLGVVAAAGRGGLRTVGAYVLLLLGGWAAGVVLGHVGKLLALSLWVWWPPGPRPKQAALYPRRLSVVEAATFAVGIETFAIGVLAGAAAAARIGACILFGSALLTAAGAAVTWSRRSRRGT